MVLIVLLALLAWAHLQCHQTVSVYLLLGPQNRPHVGLAPNVPLTVCVWVKKSSCGTKCSLLAHASIVKSIFASSVHSRETSRASAPLDSVVLLHRLTTEEEEIKLTQRVLFKWSIVQFRAQEPVRHARPTFSLDYLCVCFGSNMNETKIHRCA